MLYCGVTPTILVILKMYIFQVYVKFHVCYIQ